MAAPARLAPKLVLVSGLAREAATFAGPNILSACGDATSLRAKLAQLANESLRLVISVGICGGLDPALACGDLVIGSEVVSGDDSLETDLAATMALRQRLEGAGRRTVLGRVAGVEAPVLTAAAKARLRAASGAVVVDMESALAGRFARERGVPFAILRAVSDPAGRDLPPLVLRAVGPDGRTDMGAVISGLVRSPRQLPGLVAAARESTAAFAALATVAEIVRGVAVDR